MTALCAYCTTKMELQKDASRIAAKPLSERIYCYFCNGINGRKPHPPDILVYEVAEDYGDGQSIKTCIVKIYQYVQDSKLDVFRYYKEYIRRRNPNVLSKSEDGPKEKDRHNPYTGIFKCIFCGKKPKINYKLMQKLKINDGRLIYTCINHGENRDISFIVEKHFIAKDHEPSDLPVPAKLFWNEQLNWISWVRSYFETKLQAST